MLKEVGGFDPAYTSAGDDVDVCWKVLDANWKIGFHPAALVWHHRRSGLREYLRQQRGYGRSEALVEARHPDRFTPAAHGPLAGSHLRLLRALAGHASGSTAASTAPPPTSPSTTAAGTCSTSSTRRGAARVDAAADRCRWACSRPWLALPALVAAGGDRRCSASSTWCAPRRRARCPASGLGFRARVAVHHLLQPLARFWARARHRNLARRGLEPERLLPEPVRGVPGGSSWFPRTGRAASSRRASSRPFGTAASRPASRAAGRTTTRACCSRGWSTASCRPAAIRSVTSRCDCGPGPGSARSRSFSAWSLPLALLVSPLFALLLVPTAASLARGAVLARRLPARAPRGCGGRMSERPIPEDEVQELIGEEPVKGALRRDWKLLPRILPYLQALQEDGGRLGRPHGPARGGRRWPSRGRSRSSSTASSATRRRPRWLTAIFGDSVGGLIALAVLGDAPDHRCSRAA